MEARITAIGVTLLLVGGAVLILPILSGPAQSVSAVPGVPTDIAVPWAASITGSDVVINLTWGTPCLWWSEGGGGPACRSPNGQFPPNRAYLLVFDCGTSQCTAGVNYSFVGASSPAWYASTQFAASPGHHYQVWAYREHYPSSDWNTSVPLSFFFVEPPVGGFFGVGLMGLGVIAVVHSVQPFVRPRPPSPAWPLEG